MVAVASYPATALAQSAPWRQKARDALKLHAQRIGCAADVFADLYGWDIDRIAHDLAHRYSNGCAYCGDAFADMGRGDMTFDVIDPQRPPYYRTNVAICCFPCNRSKRNARPDAWEETLRTKRAVSAQLPIDW